MGKYATKYFGEIAIDETSNFESIKVKYKNKEIKISLSKCNIYEEKLKVCLEVLDKYIDINEMSKKAILEHFFDNKTIKYYFECHFDILEIENEVLEIFGVKTFAEFDVKKLVKLVEEFEYPDLLFGIDNSQLNVSVDYKLSKKYSDEILCVKLDEINVTGFSHES
jgi:hypothetical protein